MTVVVASCSLGAWRLVQPGLPFSERWQQGSPYYHAPSVVLLPTQAQYKQCISVNQACM